MDHLQYNYIVIVIVVTPLHGHLTELSQALEYHHSWLDCCSGRQTHTASQLTATVQTLNQIMSPNTQLKKMKEERNNRIYMSD
jgi:hypothetical protein